MIFTTVTFFLFFLIIFNVYWASEKKVWQNITLGLSSYFFYGWWDYRFCFLIMTSTIIDFCVGQLIERESSNKKRKLWLIVSIISNLSILGFFKYYNFFVENLELVLKSLGISIGHFELEILLPVGISFYTFQTMSYTIDVYRKKLKPTRSFLDYVTFVSFFPQLVAGPIERGANLLPQFSTERTFNFEQAKNGCRQILWGVVKKTLIADRLATIVASYYFGGSSTGPQVSLAVICFAFQIYCDFSAYSDIAIGLGKLFGIRLMRNFVCPYFSQSIAEFWRRWHISLSTWFRDYVFIPLGGSRLSTFFICRNIMITFVISGLWHGASWNFIIWGALNGLFLLPSVFRNDKKTLSVKDIAGGEKIFPSIKVLVRMMRTFILICCAWVFFLSKDVHHAQKIFYRIFHDLFDYAAYAGMITKLQKKPEFVLTLVYLAAFIIVDWLQRNKLHALCIEKWPLCLRWTVYTFLIWFVLFKGTQTTSQFIYFQF